MTKLTIPAKQSNSGSIYDLASDHFDRTVNFGRSFYYAVVLPSYYNCSPTRHKSAEAVESKLKELSDFNGVRVFNRDGQECCFDDFEYRGNVRILCEAEEPRQITDCKSDYEI